MARCYACRGAIKCLFVVLLSLIVRLSVADNFTLTIIHTNDVHARFDEISEHGGRCRASDASKGKCYGGVARRAAKIKELRRKFPNSILLDAGDQFQGSQWYSTHKGKAAAHFMNLLKYDAMALGNHEFDDGVDSLTHFLQRVKFPVVGANINTTFTPQVARYVAPSVVLTVGGQKVGIVGYTSHKTPGLSNTGAVIFEDEFTSVPDEASRLVALGVDKIVVVGHAGWRDDFLVADYGQKDIDVVIGGHSHTFMYTGEPPSSEKADHIYPFVLIRNDTFQLIAHAYAFGKYVGVLHVTFNERGDVVGYGGNPELLDNTVPKDRHIKAELNHWREQVDLSLGDVIGTTVAWLEGRRAICRLQECTLGDMIADAMLARHDQSRGKTIYADIAILNSGSIRASIPKGDVTVADVQRVQPFSNTVDVVQLWGEDVLRALEHSVADYNPVTKNGKFLQIAGMRVTYNMSAPNDERVICAGVLRHQNDAYTPIQPRSMYFVALPSYVYIGGDDYTMVQQNLITDYYHPFGDLDTDVIAEYMTENSPLNIQTDGRIKMFWTQDETDDTATSCLTDPNAMSSSAQPINVLHSILILSILVHVYS